MKVTLTFDNGPTPGVTEHVLDILAAHDAPAIFFVIGDKLRRDDARALVARARSDGHLIGNHTLTHSVPLGMLDDAGVDRELDECQRLVGGLACDPPLFRPYGAGGVIDDRLANAHLARRLVDGGYTCVLWSCVPRDWVDQEGWVERAIEGVRTQPWSVLVIHDIVAGALDGLPELLRRLDDEGAELTLETPDAWTPIRAGAPTSSFELLRAGPPI
jgi:peptidoglycan-N-acetylglucosamine deacetylase